MNMLKTIKGKFILNLAAAISAILLSVIVAYFIAVGSIRTIMESDLKSVSDALQKSLNYISINTEKAYESPDFKHQINSIQIGKSGYVYIMDAAGTLIVHPTKEGKSLAGKSYADHIRGDQKAALDRNAQVLKDNPDISVKVEGHCDERGTVEYNLALGDKRAVAIKNYLVELGIATDQIETISYGKEQAADPGHTEEAWSKNRRGYFRVLKQ